ncbi:MAG: Sbal_3080 family lipoprotein [Lautropia sp.]|nr:Sbal_3080 family lipoprotein [Lautropia sp.]
MQFRSIGLLLAIIGLAGCAVAPKITPVQDRSQLKNVCIIQNPKVKVADFIQVLQDRLNYHQISTHVIHADAAGSCPITLTYTATRSWDFVPYLIHAEIQIWKDEHIISHGEYRLLNGFKKWQRTATKINPIIDEMVTGIKQN